MANCSICGKPVKCEVVYHAACLETKVDRIVSAATSWIPTSERLPEPFVSVLVQMPGESPFPTVREGFITRDGIWHSALYDRDPDEVTHWMPMPQPPVSEDA